MVNLESRGRTSRGLIHLGANSLIFLSLLCCSNLHNKVGELTTQINTLYSFVSSDHNKLNQVVTQDQTINRQEVNTLINMQNQLTAKLHEIR